MGGGSKATAIAVLFNKLLSRCLVIIHSTLYSMSTIPLKAMSSKRVNMISIQDKQIWISPITLGHLIDAKK